MMSGPLSKWTNLDKGYSPTMAHTSQCISCCRVEVHHCLSCYCLSLKIISWDHFESVRMCRSRDRGTRCSTLKHAMASARLLVCAPNCFSDGSRYSDWGKGTPSPARGLLSLDPGFKHEPSIQTCTLSLKNGSAVVVLAEEEAI